MSHFALLWLIGWNIPLWTDCHSYLLGFYTCNVLGIYWLCCKRRRIFIKMGLYVDIQEPEAGAFCSVELVRKLILMLPLYSLQGVLSFVKSLFRRDTLITSKPTLPCMIIPSQQICFWQLRCCRKHSPRYSDWGFANIQLSIKCVLTLHL